MKGKLINFGKRHVMSVVGVLVLFGIILLSGDVLLPTVGYSLGAAGMQILFKINQS
jgi:hypothetical protein